MNDPRKKNPTLGVAIFIVVAVLLVIGTLLFNAIRGKREYDETNEAPSTAAASAASAATALTAPASAPAAAASAASQ